MSQVSPFASKYNSNFSEYDNDDDEYEVDISTIFKEKISNSNCNSDDLICINNLNDALIHFNYQPDDQLTRRELVYIFKTIKEAMEKEIFVSANSGNYDKAKEIRQNLVNLRSEFDNLQLNSTKRIREEQRKLFGKAENELLNNLHEKHDEEVDSLMAHINHLKEKHQLFQTIETTNLENKISLIHKPNIRYSKRLIELFKAEYNLNKLKEYNEAMKVRKMIDKLLPIEERKFDAGFERGIENQRRKLVTRQQFEANRMDEFVKKLEWKDIRRREKEENITLQRIKNHDKDMSHTHLLESKLKAEMSIKPSALWQHRKGYDFTSASLRGQQLLDNARGKKVGTQVFAESLVERHPFDEIPLSTTTLDTQRFAELQEKYYQSQRSPNK